MYHTRFIVVFEQGILTLEIETFFVECTDENLIEFILLTCTLRVSVGWSSGRSCLEIQDWRREAGDHNSDMCHRREIEPYEIESEKHLGHLGLYQTRRGEFVRNLQVFIEDIFDGRSLSSPKEILGIVHHANEYTENIFP